MSNALLMAALPETVLNRYVNEIRSAFPEINIKSVDSREAAFAYLEDTEILITFTPIMSDDVLKSAIRLKWVQALGTGVDNLVDLPSLRSDVIITNMRGIHGAPVGEAALSAMLALSRGIPLAVRQQDKAEWKRWPSRLLVGKTVGIFGVGTISEHLAPICKAIGMKVVGITSEPRNVAGFDEIYARRDIQAVIGTLDYLVVLAPLTESTRNFIDAGLLKSMKRTAYLINVARGGVVDEGALEAALRSGMIAGAALDVFVEEPLPKSHPFWSMDNVLVTSHLAGFCDVYPDLALPILKKNIRCFLDGNFAGMINRVSH